MHSHYQHKIECSFSQSTTKARCASSKFILFKPYNYFWILILKNYILLSRLENYFDFIILKKERF